MAARRPLVWLPGMVGPAGLAVQGQSLRTLAGLVPVAKLQGQTAALVNYAIAN